MKKFSELKIVGYLRHGTPHFTSWQGETDYYEVDGSTAIPDDLKIWPAENRVPYDDIVELKLLSPEERRSIWADGRFVIICLKDEPAQ